MKKASESNEGPVNGHVMDVVEDNIKLLTEHHAKKRASQPAGDRLSESITTQVGSIVSLAIHVVIFGGWILYNSGLFQAKPIDPYPFGLLTMIMSIEAILLSLFVLISQNRMQTESDQRAELDVQINLLTEYELTRLWRLTELIADKLGVDRTEAIDVEGLNADIDPKDVIEKIERADEERPWED